MISNKDKFLKEFPEAMANDAAAVFIGAGVSAGAGYPNWKDLLKEIGEELGVNSSDIQDLAALAQWKITASGDAQEVRKVIKAAIADPKPIPETLEIVARMPLRHIWTTNYDRLIERAHEAIGRPYDPISASAGLTLASAPGAVRIYKMHGSIERLEDIVISTDDYELFRSKRGGFLPLLQAHLTSFSMLFIGLSFSDPNLRHVLSMIRESFTDAPPSHFALVRTPQLEDFDNDDQFQARLTQHKHWAKDLKRYGLLVVEFDHYKEIPVLLREVEQRIARRRVWVSGSWPLGGATTPDVRIIHALSEKIGRALGDEKLTLVSGAGLLVGSGSLSGFLSSFQETAGWDLDRRLIVRPFPQPLNGEQPNENHWGLLRQELARLAGTVIFVGGLKEDDGTLVEARGVHQEREIAEKRGAFLLPIGASGGAARTIARSLIGSKLADTGSTAQRPTDAQLARLMDESLPVEGLVKAVISIIRNRPI